jgi:hypothetical protein
VDGVLINGQWFIMNDAGKKKNVKCSMTGFIMLTANDTK